MTNRKIKQVFVEAFKSLSAPQRKRLLKHADKKTPIVFGVDCYLFAREDGAG